MSHDLPTPTPSPVNAALKAAIGRLKRGGSTVEACDIPGLLVVDGRELTIGQVLSLAGAYPFQ